VLVDSEALDQTKLSKWLQLLKYEILDNAIRSKLDKLELVAVGATCKCSKISKLIPRRKHECRDKVEETQGERKEATFSNL